MVRNKESEPIQGGSQPEINRNFLFSLVEYIAQFLEKPINPDSPQPEFAIAETKERINNSAWFWIDDAGKTAELLAIPEIRLKHSELADRTLDYILSLSQGAIIHRRSALPDLNLVKNRPDDFLAYNTFFNLSGNLEKGIVCPSIRYNDGRTRIVAEYTGNFIRFKYKNKTYTVDIEDSIKSATIAESPQKIDFSHTSEIQVRQIIGGPKLVGEVSYVYSLWSSRPSIDLAVLVRIAPGVDLSDVQITTAFDQLSQERGFKYTNIGVESYFKLSPVDTDSNSSITTLPADYLCVFESNCIPGFAYGIHSLLRDNDKVIEIRASGANAGNHHHLYVKYGLGSLAGGQSLSISESRMLTGGGYYKNGPYYRELLWKSSSNDTNIDPGASYDTGAELNAIAVTILFSVRGLYGEASLSPQKMSDLKNWFDRHLSAYVESLELGQIGEPSRVFVRGLAFTIMSLDCMARAYPDQQYKGTMFKLCELLLKLEQPIDNAHDGSLFGNPELDCQAAALLAICRVSPWRCGDLRYPGAIRRGLRGISLCSAHADPNGQTSFLHTSLKVSDRIDSPQYDTAFWNFKLGLSLRAFAAIKIGLERGFLTLDQNTRNHLDALDSVARIAITPSIKNHGESVEILTSHLSTETNSETQPWVALGLFPEIEVKIFALAL